MGLWSYGVSCVAPRCAISDASDLPVVTVDSLGDAGLAVGLGTARATPASQSGADRSPPRRDWVHAVPVDDVVPASNRLAEALYRAFEMLIAAIGLVLALPVLLFLSLLIRYDSPGPALFFHKRSARSIIMRGRDLAGRGDLCPPPDGYKPNGSYYVPSVFRFVKFRTMYRDAKVRFPELYEYEFAPEDFHRRHFKNDNDPRVTRIGQVLRKLTVDELPNLWCVLVGDMRLVGPRPESPNLLRYYTPDEMYKFSCKPGITGLAQINGRGLLNFGQTLAWDLQYVRTRSVWLDIKIIAITVKCIIIRRGAF
jgi:lipopolysaccharide/colanic/teichoic acid biosynthesis glycosyltransferase